MRNTLFQTIMSAKAATGSSNAVQSENYQTVNFTVSGATSPTGTIKFFSSDSVSFPDVTSAQSPTNAWDYVAVIDLQTGSVIAGDTGIAFAGTADTRRFAMNANGARWTGCVITAYSAGTYTVDVRAFANAA